MSSSSSNGKEILGIIGALPEEINKLKENIKIEETIKVNKFYTFYKGIYETSSSKAIVNVVFTASTVGKTSAASVTTLLIERFKVTKIVFTGVAGGVSTKLKIGDIVIGTDVIDYEMNCKAFILPFDTSYRHKLGEIPFIKLREFVSDKSLVKLAKEASDKLKKSDNNHDIGVYEGRIVTGSEFVDAKRKQHLLESVWSKEMGDVLAVEMEGSAVGQIAAIYDVPFLLLRSISDTLKGDASDDFNKFCKVAADNLWTIVSHVIENFAK